MPTVVDASRNGDGNGMRRVMLAAAMIVATVLGSAGAARGATTAEAACTNGVQVISFAFTPPSVAAGQTATATLVAQSCTGQSQQDSVLWYGRFFGSGTGFPAGCPAFDPLILPLNLPATGSATSSLTYLVPAMCTASSLEVTATIRGASGATLTTATATLAINARTGGCRVAYTRQSEWPGGFVASVTITNDSGSALSGWSLVFSFGGDQRVTSAWNATVTQSGSTVTAVNAAYNGSVPAGGTVTFGMQGSWHTSDAPPTAYQLNGVACA
jgi:hypothetical protein